MDIEGKKMKYNMYACIYGFSLRELDDLKLLNEILLITIINF